MCLTQRENWAGREILYARDTRFTSGFVMFRHSRSMFRPHSHGFVSRGCLGGASLHPASRTRNGHGDIA